MIIITVANPEMSPQALRRVEVIMLSLGFSLRRCQSFTVESRTKKAIR